MPCMLQPNMHPAHNNATMHAQSMQVHAAWGCAAWCSGTQVKYFMFPVNSKVQAADCY